MKKSDIDSYGRESFQENIKKVFAIKKLTFLQELTCYVN